MEYVELSSFSPTQFNEYQGEAIGNLKWLLWFALLIIFGFILFASIVNEKDKVYKYQETDS